MIGAFPLRNFYHALLAYIFSGTAGTIKILFSTDPMKKCTDLGKNVKEELRSMILQAESIAVRGGQYVDV